MFSRDLVTSCLPVIFPGYGPLMSSPLGVDIFLTNHASIFYSLVLSSEIHFQSRTNIWNRVVQVTMFESNQTVVLEVFLYCKTLFMQHTSLLLGPTTLWKELGMSSIISFFIFIICMHSVANITCEEHNILGQNIFLLSMASQI